MAESITALVILLTSHVPKSEKGATRRLSAYETQCNGQIEIQHLLAGTMPASKKKPLAISFARYGQEIIRCRKGDILQVEGTIEPLTKQQDCLFVTKCIIPTRVGEKAFRGVSQHGATAQEIRNSLIKEKSGFKITDAPELAGINRQDVLALDNFLYSHGFPYDVEMAYFIITYFSRRISRRSHESVAQAIIDNPIILAELRFIDPNFSSKNIIKAFDLKPSEETRLYIKAAAYLQWCARKGDTFVPKNAMYGILSDDLADKPEGYLDKLLFQRSRDKSFISVMSRIAYCSPRRVLPDGYLGPAMDYLTQKIYEEKKDMKKAASKARSMMKQPAIYLIKNFFLEKDTAAMLAAHLGLSDKHYTLPIATALTGEQQTAVRMAFSSRTSIITGGAGTGKTAVVSEIVRLAEQNGARAIVLAPSAKAAAHTAAEVFMSTGHENPYQTIHRFVKTLPEDEDPGETGDISPNDPDASPFDFVIIDEMSMCTLQVFNKVLKSIQDETHLILVGDPMQLPAIGAQFFRELADGLLGDDLPVTRLTQNFRASHDELVSLCERIRTGRFEPPQSASIHFLEDTKMDDFIAAHQDIAKDENTVFLAARLKEVNHLNICLRKLRNPDAVPIENPIFYLGDRIITTQNDYVDSHKESSPLRTCDIYNGTDGIIESYEDGIVNVRMYSFNFGKDGRVFQYRPSELGIYMQPAFALSVHKSQGSQYPRVVFACSSVLNRNMIYTAVSRAKDELYILGRRSDLEASCEKTAHYGNSLLAYRTIEERRNTKVVPEQDVVVSI